MSLGPEAVREAALRIAGLVERTPVTRCAALDERSGCELHFKREDLQLGGAFKLRGASNVLQLMEAAGDQRPVATHSSGNHGNALGIAAARCGRAAYVVVPQGANRTKRANIEASGATLIDCEATMSSRLETLARVVEETGAVPVSPFDDARIIAGQGTAALELLEQVPDLDAILVPVGGGGLLAGCLLAVATAGRELPVHGVEPELADAAWRSRQQGQRVPQDASDTLADGLRASVGELNWQLIEPRAASLSRVSEQAIVAAMRLLWEEGGMEVEPSSAVPLAALLVGELGASLTCGGRDHPRVGIILTGGNVDRTRLPW